MTDETTRVDALDASNAAQNSAPTPERAPSVDAEDRRATRRSIYAVLIFLALGVGFGKIVAVDSLPDRAIQNNRLAQIPKTLQNKEKELREKGVSGERLEAEMKRVYAAALRDAAKARPTLSANDRSRWLTIRALVEPEARVYRYVPVYKKEARAAAEKARREALKTYPPRRDKKGEIIVESEDETVAKFAPAEILRNCASLCPEQYDAKRAAASPFVERYRKELVPYAIDKAWETPGWDSIDVVKHGLPDEIYDPSNPASGYIYSSKPTLLPTVMAGPYWVLNRCFGLSLAKKPFETTRILLVIYQLIPLGIAFFCLASIIESVGKTDWGRMYAVAAATFGTFALTFVPTLNNHLPGFASISIALWAAFKILRDGKKNPLYYAAAGFFGAFAVACDLPALAFAAGLCGVLLVKRPLKTIFVAIPAGLVVAAAFIATNYIAHRSIMPAYSCKRDHMAMKAEAEKNNVDPKTLFDANDWYYYNYYPAGRPREAKYARLSHWANRTGIDRGEPSVARYAFHSTVGSRGVFSLTPIWILSVLGLCVWTLKPGDDKNLRAFGVGALTLTVVFFAFFLTRDQGDRNYGGMSCWSRWFFPLVPLFVPALLPIVDRASKSRVSRGVALAALFWSAASAAFPTWNPWVAPWLYDIAVNWGWMKPY
ncbi:MAG: hypothetical protein IJ387_09345 [Thermoguttaceae bacterium]|nr:hypothetical protein [Thermoguttaceae bacterium]